MLTVWGVGPRPPGLGGLPGYLDPTSRGELLGPGGTALPAAQATESDGGRVLLGWGLGLGVVLLDHLPEHTEGGLVLVPRRGGFLGA